MTVKIPKMALMTGALVFSNSAASGAPIDPHTAALDAISRTCSGREGQQVSKDRLAQALLLETEPGLPGDEPSPSAVLSKPEALVDRAADRARQQSNLLRAIRALLIQDLARPGTDIAKALKVAPAPPEQTGPITNDWLFGDGSSGADLYTLSCPTAKKSSAPEFAKLPVVMIRKSADELAKIGDARTTAGSAQGTFNSSRVTDLKGQTKLTKSLVVNAAAAITLAGNEDAYALVFGDYTKSHARISSHPTPTDPSKNGSADDVNALELGLLGTARLGYFARATGHFGYVMDFVSHARFVTFNGSLTPVTGGGPDLGFCNLGSFKYLGLGVDAECSVSLQGDVHYVVAKGTSALTAKDYILAAGPVIGVTLRRTLDLNGRPQDGLVGTITYKYLPVLTGTAPDLRRVDASLTYRWWTNNVGIDFGLTYANGIDRKTLNDEHSYGLMFGLIY